MARKEHLSLILHYMERWLYFEDILLYTYNIISISKTNNTYFAYQHFLSSHTCLMIKYPPLCQQLLKRSCGSSSVSMIYAYFLEDFLTILKKSALYNIKLVRTFEYQNRELFHNYFFFNLEILRAKQPWTFGCFWYP